MKTETAPTVTRLSDYTPPNFKITETFLDFDLVPNATRVKSRLVLERLAPGPLTLDGEDIALKSVTLDGKALKRKDYQLTQTQLILNDLPDQCILEIETVCDPAANTTLMGLYVSGGRFCTQCEAEGFRRITYYLDRPDAMSVFTVRMTADREQYFYLLANGNMIDSGTLADGRHFAVWHDPFPKPCYLFALVAGEFDTLEDTFITMSGRDIPLTIYVDPGDAPRAEYAMDALKRSMKWDEEAFGREYDLDRFMIVAVRDFNFGAMENKGLNIFNSALLLADAKTATDLNFERIESVVAHEYFHNWTGNRITCRDWFQLCLKEGFTVFRDQEFSADQRGKTVQRIKDVRALRMRQFPEDAGPLAHAVRPEAYEKIDNFYTATVYEKGAELIRMLKLLLGDVEFRKGCDYYFDTLDGTAATIEQFVACFEQSSGRSLDQFMPWYRDAGTPKLTVRTERTPSGLDITLSQQSAPTPGQKTKSDKLIPVRWQVIQDNGETSAPMQTVLADNTVVLPYATDYAGDMTVSILQDFSAPVTLDAGYSPEDIIRMMTWDDNGFNRWEAGQTLARSLMRDMTQAIESGTTPPPAPALRAYTAALAATLDDDRFEPAFKALVLTPPSEAEILQSLEETDPTAVHFARHWLERAIADDLREALLRHYEGLTDEGPFRPEAKYAGRRALRNRCLSLLAARQDPEAAPLAIAQFNDAQNMTDELSALITLTRLGGRRIDSSMDAFFEKWKDKPLVIDKWFAVAAGRENRHPKAYMQSLVNHPAYNAANPNRVRALIGGFAMSNPTGFHRHDGSGYRFFTDQILDMDSRNPSVAARLLGLFEVRGKLDRSRQNLIGAELERILAADPSKNVREIAGKLLG